MSQRQRVLDEVRAAFHSEPRFGPSGHVNLDLSEDGTLTITGEVQSVAVKKRHPSRAGAQPDVREIVDRLRVAPAQRMEDHRIRNLVGDALLQEPALGDLSIRERVKDEVVTLREPPDPPRGEISIAVEDGLVMLRGTVPSTTCRRLAGVLAWWVPGTRDVCNAIVVAPPEEDNDDDITEPTPYASCWKRIRSSMPAISTCAPAIGSSRSQA